MLTCATERLCSCGIEPIGRTSLRERSISPPTVSSVSIYSRGWVSLFGDGRGGVPQPETTDEGVEHDDEFTCSRPAIACDGSSVSCWRGEGAASTKARPERAASASTAAPARVTVDGKVRFRVPGVRFLR
jgi:hypothetical protein